MNYGEGRAAVRTQDREEGHALIRWPHAAANQSADRISGLLGNRDPLLTPSGAANPAPAQLVSGLGSHPGNRPEKGSQGDARSLDSGLVSRG